MLFKTSCKSSLLQPECILKSVFSIDLGFFSAFALANGVQGKDPSTNNGAGSGSEGYKVKSAHCYAWPD